jgi:hypothetical protein
MSGIEKLAFSLFLVGTILFFVWVAILLPGSRRVEVDVEVAVGGRPPLLLLGSLFIIGWWRLSRRSHQGLLAGDSRWPSAAS